MDSIRPGRVTGDPVVQNLRVLRYVPSPVPQIEYKVAFNHEFKTLPQRIKRPRDKWEMTRLFQTRLPIKKSKYDHLQQLKSVMPAIYHQFYDDLQYS